MVPVMPAAVWPGMAQKKVNAPLSLGVKVTVAD
jgi:hypothetical protein